MGPIKTLIIVTLFICTYVTGYCQLPKPILNDAKIVNIIKKGLDNIYNIDVDETYKINSFLSKEWPNHPITPFFKGLTIYWQHYPLSPDKKESADFLKLMNEAIELSVPILKKNENDVEGVFFDLAAKAFLMMYYADNAMSSRVIRIAPSTYKHVMKSFDLKEEMDEFYFIAGLYNYYIVAYPRKHPIYRPVAMLFKSGDTQEGLKQLHYAHENAYFLKTEAAFFLSFIYFDFEGNNKMAIKMIGDLHRTYPGNPMYFSQYIKYLLGDKQYGDAEKLNQQMVQQHKNNPYMVMKGIIFKGMVEEKLHKNYDKAKENYEMGIKISGRFGKMADNYVSYAYYGLARIEKIKGNDKLSRDYSKKAASLSNDAYFID